MGKLILTGGGDLNQSRNTNLQFLQIIDKTKPMLYIPLAMPLNQHSYNQCLDWAQTTFRQLNYSNIVLGTNLDNLGNLDNYSSIYIEGGNTYLLLDFIRKSDFFDDLKDFILLDNGIVYGSSAGAIILGDDIRSSNDENKVMINCFEGLNMLKGFCILPHWSNDKEYRIQKLYSQGIDRIICIPEDSSLIYDTDSRIGFVVGYIKVYDGKEIQEYKNGSEINL